MWALKVSTPTKGKHHLALLGFVLSVDRNSFTGNAQRIVQLCSNFTAGKVQGQYSLKYINCFHFSWLTAFVFRGNVRAIILEKGIVSGAYFSMGAYF